MTSSTQATSCMRPIFTGQFRGKQRDPRGRDPVARQQQALEPGRCEIRGLKRRDERQEIEQHEKERRDLGAKRTDRRREHQARCRDARLGGSTQKGRLDHRLHFVPVSYISHVSYISTGRRQMPRLRGLPRGIQAANSPAYLMRHLMRPEPIIKPSSSRNLQSRPSFCPLPPIVSRAQTRAATPCRPRPSAARP